MQGGFSRIDISPDEFPVRTYLGTADAVLDPLYANAAVFENGVTRLAILSLDVVILEWPYVERIRREVSATTGIPEANLLVCATHNHACPAVVDRPGHLKEHAYLDRLVRRGVEAVAEAWKAREPVRTGIGSGLEARVSFNRRFLLRDGTACTQPQGDALRNLLCNEGVIDPEVGVLAVQSARTGRLAGLLVNFGCHAVHHMGALSAGYPGVLAAALRDAFGPNCVTVFLNGPCGNVHHRNFLDPAQADTPQTAGTCLAETVERVVRGLTFLDTDELDAAEARLEIPYRPLDELEQGTDRLVNVFQSLIQRGWYEHSLEVLRALHARAPGETAVLQALRIGQAFFPALPGEIFNEHGLRIKRESGLRHTFPVSLANGWLGYIPTRAAFDRRGGHETTLALWSKMAPDAGDRMADQALQLLRALH